MKLAPWVALAAIGTFLAAVAWAKRPPMPDQSLPLDFSGVDTLVVQTQDSRIALDDAAPYRISFGYSESALVERHGATLTIRGKGTLHEIRAPSTLRRLVVDGATIEAKDAIGEMDLETTRPLSWEGDARILRIDKKTFERDCYSCSIDIDDGQIGMLFVRAHEGHISIRSANVAAVVLALGEKATYSLRDLHGTPPPVTLVGEHGAPPPPGAPDTVVADPALRP
jgi:hypothetical protein